MEQRISTFLILLLLSFTGIHCNNNEPFDGIVFHYEYYPLTIGQTWVYQVDSIKYDGNFTPPAIDTARYQIKEVVESIFDHNEGRESHRIEVFKRNNDTLPWEILNVYFTNRTESTAEKVEDNLRFIKLIFPATPGSKWAGNAFIDAVDEHAYLKDWEYQIIGIDAPYNASGETFHETLSVLQEDETNAIERRYGFEVYAKDVGMIYKELINLERDSDPFGEWESGFILQFELINYSP